MPVSGPTDKSVGILADQLLTLALLIVRTSRDEEKIDLTPAQRAILSRVVNNGPQTITELAKSQQVSLPSITKHVQKLEVLGYVIRKTDDQDRRISRIDYTSKTWTTLERSKQNQSSVLARRIAGLPPTDIAKLEKLIPTLQALVK